MLNYSTRCKVLGMPTVSSTRSRGRRATRPSGDERESAILNTLERMLDERTFGEISVDDLAKGAGLSRPTFYFYFPSKDAVLARLFARMIAATNPAAVQSPELATAADPIQVCRTGIFAFFEALRPHRGVAVAGLTAMGANAELRDLWSQFMTAWVDRTAELIEAERARGAAPATIPARDLATALNLMNERVVFAAQGDQQPKLPEDAALEAVAHVWVMSIYGTCATG